MTLSRSPSSGHLLAEAGERGMTWSEYAELSGGHHGTASAALSRMHGLGQAVRLAERRDNNSVYVHPDYVADRPTVRRTTRTKAPEEGMSVEDVQALIDAAEAVTELRWAAERVELEAEFLVTQDGERAEWVAAMADLRNEMQLERHAEREHFETMFDDIKAKDETVRKRYAARTAEAANKHERELAKKVADAAAKAREEGEAKGWNEGYDEGIKRSQDSLREGDPFTEGRALGRTEGEEMVRKRVGAVAVEMHKAIVESAPVRTHFKGCYKIHPECAVKALGRAAGIPAPRMGLSRAG